MNWKEWSSDKVLEEAGARGWITREGPYLRLSQAMKDEMFQKLESMGVGDDDDVTTLAQNWLDLNKPLLDTQSEDDARLAFGMTLLASGKD
ncbi:MAG: hypothetical protein L0387_19600 [Acidobacteria bacterium]|nr:hypothetical protein [Acidobacteriota bacterium]MCI0721829.1 hypothetical protein [Acidobacteriota bacterium]